MSHSSGRRGQVEPVPAVVALLVVGAGLGLYAGALDARLPSPTPRDPSSVALDRVHERVADGRVLVPDRLDRAPAAAPAGWTLNATLLAAERRWAAGPSPPGDGRSSARAVGVVLAPGSVQPGRLEVTVWR